MLEGLAVACLAAFAGHSGWRLANSFPKFEAIRHDEDRRSDVARAGEIEFERLTALARLSAWTCLLLPLLFMAPFFVLAIGSLGLLGVVICVAISLFQTREVG